MSSRTFEQAAADHHVVAALRRIGRPAILPEIERKIPGDVSTRAVNQSVAHLVESGIVRSTILSRADGSGLILYCLAPARRKS